FTTVAVPPVPVSAPGPPTLPPPVSPPPVSPPPPHRPPLRATFNPNLLLRGSAGAAEPSIRTTSGGTPFVIAPTGVPAGCKAFRVSRDGSRSAFLGYPDGTVGGGDCDWAIGPGDVLAYSSLSLANLTVGKSTDGGTTFGPPNPLSQQVTLDDRQWMAADPQRNELGQATMFMVYHDLATGQIELGVSRDGGFTYA